MNSRVARRRSLFVLITALTLFAEQAAAQTWHSTTSSNWNNAANWTPGIPVSGSTTALIFGAGTYTATNDIPTTPFVLDSLTFGASGTVTLADSGQGLSFAGTTPTITMGAGNAVIGPVITLPPATVPGNPSATPPVPATNSIVTITGGATAGTLTFNGAINDGSTGVVGGGASALANNSGGTVNISGGGNITQLLLGGGATNIPSGTLAITQVDSGLREPAISIGEATGQTPSLTVSGGAVLNTGDNIYIGDAAGSTGTLTVTGAGSAINHAYTAGTAAAPLGRLAIGNSGSGTLNITNGGSVTTAFIFMPRNPAITGPPTSAPTNSGTLNVTGPGSTLTVTADASFCSNGFGTVTFSNGATLSEPASSAVVMGVNPLGNGTVTFTGSGTTATAGQTIIAYAAQISGLANTCTLNITNGASYTALNAMFIGLGFTANPEGGTLPATGIVNVSGAGSTLSVPDPVSNTIPQAFINASTALIIGGGSGPGNGTLNITAGGTVVTSYLTVGNNQGASGTVNVSGVRSTLTSVGEADIGTGTSGGVVNAGVGTIVSFGPTYIWTSGVLNVNTGTLGSFTVNGLYDGYDVGLGTSTGSVVVGAGSTLVISPDGNNGGSTSPASFSGVISGAGGVTKTGPGTQVFTGGVNTFTGPLGINGGILVFGAAADLGAGAVINFGGGTLQWATGNTTDISTSAVTFNAGGATIDTNGNNVSFLGGIGGGGVGGLTKTGAGTLTLNPGPPTGGTVGYNSYTGTTRVLNGTLAVSSDLALGVINTGTAAAPVFVEGGNVTGAATGTLLFTASTTTPRSYAMGGGTIAVAATQTLTFSGSQVSSAILSGPGSYATGANGASFVGVTTQPGVALNSASSSDSYTNFSNGGTLSIAASLASPVTFSAFTNQGSGSIAIGAATTVNVSAFQSYGLLNLSPSTAPATSKLKNTGTSLLYFNGGSRTFVGTVATAGTFTAGIDLNGQNAEVAGGLFVNNGYVIDSSGGGTGTHTVVADYGALVKGAGFFQNSPITQNGGRVQAGNSPGAASFGNLTFGPGGVGNYVFAIDDATGQAGPTPNANGQVSGWGLAKVVQQSLGAVTTPGSFAWTASPSNPLDISIQTLLNPTTSGTDPLGLMSNFNPLQSYSWLAAEWSGAYTGPTDSAALNASTTFDVSQFQNPIAGTFGWNLDSANHQLDLVYNPSAVPEPGTLALVGCVAVGFGVRRIRAIRRR